MEVWMPQGMGVGPTGRVAVTCVQTRWSAGAPCSAVSDSVTPGTYLPGSSVGGTGVGRFQAGVLAWVAISFPSIFTTMCQIDGTGNSVPCHDLEGWHRGPCGRECPGKGVYVHPQLMPLIPQQKLAQRRKATAFQF